jgi:hypothetical protein
MAKVEIFQNRLFGVDSMPTKLEPIERAEVGDQQKGNSLRRNGFRIAAALWKK